MRRYLLAFIFVGTCLGQKIDTEFDKSLDFSQFKTFSLRDGKVNSKSGLISNELVEKNLHAEIVAQLKAKGLTEVETKADLNVTFRLTGSLAKEQVFAPGQRVETVGPRGRVVERTTRSRKATVTQAKDTLVIDLRNTATKELAWRAICVDKQDDAVKLEKRLPSMVVKAFQKYPPKKK